MTSELLMLGALVSALTTGTWEDSQTRLFTDVPPEPDATWLFLSSDLLPGRRFRVTVALEPLEVVTGE